MLQINIQPEIKKQFEITEADWKRKKHATVFKKLIKDEEIMLTNC